MSIQAQCETTQCVSRICINDSFNWCAKDVKNFVNKACQKYNYVFVIINKQLEMLRIFKETRFV